MPECAKAFQEAKDQLMFAQVLTQYNPTLPISMAVDASTYSMDAVTSHVFQNGSQQLIAFALNILIATENNYVQLEKELVSGYESSCMAVILPGITDHYITH